MSFKLINSESKPLTMELAQQFSTMEPSPTERDLNPARIKHLRSKAEAGHLVSFSWSKAKLGNRHLRMNGQHSSTMLAELNGTFPQGLMAHIDEYEVDDELGLALLFRQFDDRKSSRSISDVASAYQGIYPQLESIDKKNAKLGVEGIAWQRRDVEGQPAPTGDDLYQWFQQQGLHPFLLWLNEVFTMKTDEMRRKEIVGAMYGTFITNEPAARTFWETVSSGAIHLDEHAPEQVLDQWFQAAKTKQLKEDIKPAQFYQGSIYAWNAARDGRLIKEIKSDTKKGWLPVNQ